MKTSGRCSVTRALPLATPQSSVRLNRRWRFACLCALFSGGCRGDAPPQRAETPSAMQVLGSYLGRATSVQMVADSELRVTEVEWTRSPMTSADRENAALVDVRNVEKHWPDPRLRRVTVVFERLRRLGPLVVGKSDTALHFPVTRTSSNTHLP